jgi:hypothetical protein
VAHRTSRTAHPQTAHHKPHPQTAYPQKAHHKPHPLAQRCNLQSIFIPNGSLLISLRPAMIDARFILRRIMMSHTAYIYDAVRTPRSKGKAGGSLNSVKPIDLGATLLRELQRRHDLDTSYVDDVVMGCVTPIGEHRGPKNCLRMGRSGGGRWY